MPRPFFATLLIGLLGNEETDVKATSNCRYIRIQVRSPLSGVCRIHLGAASKTLSLQAPAISIYRHSCQTLDRKAFRPNHGLAWKGPQTGYGLGEIERDSVIGFGPGDFDSYIRV
jgi:hypothetical protein